MLLKADPVRRRQTNFRPLEEDGSFAIESRQDVQEIIEGNHEMRRHWDGRRAPMGRDGVMAGRIPEVIWDELVRTGIAFDDDALLAWLEDPDNAAWKMHPGKFSRRGTKLVVA